ncbi:D-alanine--D-alanine ligase [Mesorhizobium carmichaelinearum]|uniref:D-alanine--D-alanine ligase n=1 Tax=Mesorhizobium carmichaelinearum TaxID=1208188 RepID=UPI001FCF160C|nr:D-alanine--D-alanine ligase [Mesorhizobium carmichaelinearum]
MAIPDTNRPFSVKHLYHVSRDDGLVRTIPFRPSFTIADVQAELSGVNTRPGRTLLAMFDAVKSRDEYIVNLLHGQFGEDGGVQTLAALSKLNGTFGDPYVASLTMNKYAMSSFVSYLLSDEIVRVPKTKLVKPGNVEESIISAISLGVPIVVKPNSLGSSLFTKLFYDPIRYHVDIDALIRTIFEYDNAALLQEFIPGDEYSCGCIIGSGEIISLPVVKIEAGSGFFGRSEKYSGGSGKKTKLESSDRLSSVLTSISKDIASSIDVYNMIRVDFRITELLEVFFLECNYIPGLAKDSTFTAMLHHHGMTVIDFIYWLVTQSNSFTKPNHYIGDESI